MKFFVLFYSIFTISFISMNGFAQNKKPKKVLIVFSSKSKVTLMRKPTSSKPTTTHNTGFFLSELMVPLKAMLEAGFQPVYASPEGTKPIMDSVSDSKFWFGNNEKDYNMYKNLCIKQGLCSSKNRIGSTNTLKLSEVINQGLNQFSGVFFPGGHAPMEDLYKNIDVGTVLTFFHKHKKPTGLICHAPIALLSTLEKPYDFGVSLNKLLTSSRLISKYKTEPGSKEKQKKLEKALQSLKNAQKSLKALKQNWIYQGYKIAVFTTEEEKEEEPGGSDNALGAFMRFYPDQALEEAGSLVQRAKKWKSKVIKDRELITGQNPFSDKEFAKVFLEALSGK